MTYLDRDNAAWALEYLAPGGKAGSRRVDCGDTGVTKTATFLLADACFPGKGYEGTDMAIRAIRADAVIRFVRIVKLDPASVAPPSRPSGHRP